MAQQTKTTAARKNGTSASKQQSTAQSRAKARAEAEKRRFISLVLFFYGVFMLFLTFISGAGFWHTLHDFTWGLFGMSAIIYAPLVIYISIMVATERSQGAVIKKLIQGLLVILLFCGLFQILMIGSVEGKTVMLQIKGLYNDGVKRQGGGLLSAIFGWSLLKIFKRVGATILIILLTLFFFFMLSNWTLPQVWRFISKPFIAAYNALKEEDSYERSSDESAVKPKEKAPKATKEENKNKRVDIAKYYKEEETEDDADDTGYESFSTIDELEHSEDFDIILPPRPFGPKPKKKNYFDEIDKLSRSRQPSEGKATYTDDDITTPDFSVISENEIDAQAQQMQQLIDRSAEEPAGDTTYEEEMFVDNDGQSSFIDQTKNEKPQELPPISLLKTVSNKVNNAQIDAESQMRASTLVDTLKSFGVQTRVVGIHRGPSVTRYELQPAAGVKVSKITSLADDIALNLAAQGVRIEAPIPGKAAVGIELSNTTRETVSIRELVDSEEFRSADGKLCFAVGRNIEGSIVVGDIRKMPHLLIAGTTGSGKSVFTNSIIMNILYRATSDEVKLMLIDPKQVEFPIYNGIPHLIAPVITEPRKAAGALGWAVTEMTRRYSLFSDNSVREFGDYNELARENGYEVLPHIVIIIDELADLMMAASKEVEDSICRLAQLARAAGMHLIIATQTPRVDVVTGLIKANLPSRVALKVSNNTDSRIILDEGGAEKLLGNGDLLFKPVGLDKPKRIQGSFVSTSEIRAVVKFLKNQQTADYDEQVLDGIEKNIPVPKGEKPQSDFDIDSGNKNDDMLEAAIRIVVENQQASTSFLQRKLNLGYARAARIMDNMEALGIVGPAVGAKPREVRMTLAQWQEREATRS